jgi:hypothetical protein
MKVEMFLWQLLQVAHVLNDQDTCLQQNRVDRSASTAGIINIVGVNAYQHSALIF